MKRSALIDTGPLVLLAVGLFDIELIEKHKKTKSTIAFFDIPILLIFKCTKKLSNYKLNPFNFFSFFSFNQSNAIGV